MDLLAFLPERIQEHALGLGQLLYVPNLFDPQQKFFSRQHLGDVLPREATPWRHLVPALRAPDVQNNDQSR